MLGLRYTTRGADTFKRNGVERCPICEFPMGNGFQLTCEPGACRYREVTVTYKKRRLNRAA